jgi:hypothetical protein
MPAAVAAFVTAARRIEATYQTGKPPDRLAAEPFRWPLGRPSNPANWHRSKWMIYARPGAKLGANTGGEEGLKPMLRKLRLGHLVWVLQAALSGVFALNTWRNFRSIWLQAAADFN